APLRPPFGRPLGPCRRLRRAQGCEVGSWRGLPGCEPARGRLALAGRAGHRHSLACGPPRCARGSRRGALERPLEGWRLGRAEREWIVGTGCRERECGLRSATGATQLTGKTARIEIGFEPAPRPLPRSLPGRDVRRARLALLGRRVGETAP